MTNFVGIAHWRYRMSCLNLMRDAASIASALCLSPAAALRRVERLAALALILPPLLAPSEFGGVLPAQFDANLGRIVGFLTGPDGGAISGAEVLVTGAGSGLERSVRSDTTGWFQAGSLQPGEYTIVASSPDFAPATAEGIVVKVGSTIQVDLRLDLEQTYTKIEVTAAMLDAMLPASSNVVGSKIFNDLPINGRRFHDFALLTPTVQVSRAAGHLSFAAMRGIYTNVTVDGTDYNQSFFGGIQGGERAGSVITVPQSAIQEFQAVTSGFTAEYGRTVSGVVNVSTKSGANDLHGDLFYQIRHPEFGVADPFGAKVLEQLQQFGGSAGGPLRRDKAFWFAAVERQTSSSPRYVEFPSLLSANRARGPEAYDYFKSLEEPFEATNDAWALTPRLDYQFGGGSRLMLRYNFSNADALNAVSIGDPKQARTTNAVSNDGTEKDSIHFLTGQLTSLLSPNVVNQLRLTVTREQRPRGANARQAAVSTAIGNFGTRSFLPTTETDVKPVVRNNLMMHAGLHDFKIGGDFDWVWINQLFGYDQFGHFRLFSPDPDEILDILTPGGRIPNRFDAPGLYFRQIGDLVGMQGVAHAAVYAQDSWRVTPGLTLDLGFRWEGQFNQKPQTGNRVLLDRLQGADFAFGELDPTSVPSDLRQWMPRVGFAYSPQGLSRNVVLRGSFGIFHAVTPPVFLIQGTTAFREPPANLSVTLPTSESTVYRQFLAAGIDLNEAALADLPVFSKQDVTRVLDGDPYLGAAPQLVSPDFRNPRSRKYTLAIERSMTDRMVAGLQWMRYRTTRLHTRRDHNLPGAYLRPDDPARIPYYDTGNRPAPLLSSVIVTESLGRANYDGVTANWQYAGDRIQWVTHYTYARAYSSDINEGYFWQPLYTDHARPEDAYGPSSLDMRHQLTGHAVIALPAGFTWSAILRASSGPPLNPAAGTDLNGDQFASDRALQAPGRYFGRNVFRNRGMRNLDMRLLRRFPSVKGSSLELSVELFNAFNLDNVEYGRFNAIYGPGLDLATGEPIGPNPSFRRLRGAEGGYDRNNTQVLGVGPLQAQVGLRFFF